MIADNAGGAEMKSDLRASLSLLKPTPALLIYCPDRLFQLKLLLQTPGPIFA